MSRKRDRKQKFVEQREEQIPSLQPKTQAQAEYVQALIHNKIVIASGYCGTGKTKIAAHKAGEWLRTGQIEKIVVARPYVQMGRTAGFRPGTTEEKLYPYVRNILDNVKLVVGKSYQHYTEKKLIEIQALEDIRGRSFDEDCVLIIDEAQNTTPEEMRSIVTRIGEGCRLILCGDPHQKDIKEQSGLEWFRDFIQKHDISDSAYIEFDVDDIVRSNMVKEIVVGLVKDNVNY